jgi:hypothetical protein
MTAVTLLLRTDTKYVADDNATVTRTAARPDTIDLDELTPRARALAEAVAQLPGGRKGAGEILCEHTSKTRADMTPNASVWLTPEQMTEPARQTWAAWDKYPADSPTSAAEYLERQARKIPHDWRIVCAVWFGGSTQIPVESSEGSATDQYLTRDQALAYMRERGRDISVSTWSAYVARKQAPPPDRRIGRTPLWRPETLDAFLKN